MTTLGDMIRRYMETYGLTEGDGPRGAHALHDGVHVMTGFGATVADELRIAVVEHALNDYDATRTLKTAFDRAANLRKGFVEFYTNGRQANVDAGGYETKAFEQHQVRTPMISEAEIAECFALGCKMREAVKAQSGKQYALMNPEDVMALNFATLDFTAEANAIKMRHMRPENREIEALSARELRKQRAAKGGQGPRIPRLGKSWAE